MSNIVKAGHYQMQSGQVIRYDNSTPVWMAIEETCQNMVQLQNTILAEYPKCPGLRGIAAMKHHGEIDLLKGRIMQIFQKVSTAYRDPGLMDPKFIDEVVEMLIQEQAYYWMSAAHIKYAIMKGVRGHYDIKYMPNKVVVLHFKKWIDAFQEEWMNGVEAQRFEENQRTKEPPRSGKGNTIGEIFKDFKKK